MNETVKTLFLLLLSATLICCLDACRQSKEPANNSSPAPIAATIPPPFAWSEVSKRYVAVKQYTAVYEKEEKAISKGEKQTIKFSFRKPFDVRMDWLDDKGKVDQTAIYEEGKNDGKILTKKSGMLGLILGTVKLNPDSPIALEDSKHPITKVGLGSLIDRLTAEANDPQTRTTFLGEENSIDGRVVYKIEMSSQTGLDLTGSAEAIRAVVSIDKELLLPIKVEIYDEKDILLERHVFRKLKLNANLTDKTFEM